MEPQTPYILGGAYVAFAAMGIATVVQDIDDPRTRARWTLGLFIWPVTLSALLVVLAVRGLVSVTADADLLGMITEPRSAPKTRGELSYPAENTSNEDTKNDE